MELEQEGLSRIKRRTYPRFLTYIFLIQRFQTRMILSISLSMIS